jgi:hypothetical protein
MSTDQSPSVHNWLYGLAVASLLTASTALVVLAGVWIGGGFRVPPFLELGITPIEFPLGSTEFELQSTEQWINCPSVRDLIEEGGRLYLGCEGGILIVTPDGEIIDQFSMADGLKNNFVNSLSKRGDWLYVGHQDGFSLVNLLDRSVQNISIEQGLHNAANVRLALDGDWLWVGTFDGVARYNLSTRTLENFRDEFRLIGSQQSVSDIVVTSKATYFVFNTHAYSNGGIVRFDKSSSEFELIERSKFAKARMDINDLISYDGVLLASDWTDMWIAEDRPNADWEMHTGIQERIGELAGQERPTLRFVGFRNGQPLILAANILYSYNLQSREVSVLYPQQSHAENVTHQAGIAVVKPDAVWLNRGSSLNLIRFNLESLTHDRVVLADRPSSFQQVLGVIDEQPILLADYSQLWRLGNRGFEKLYDFDSEGGISPEFGGVTLAPIVGTNQVLVYYQSCGQGCSQPKLHILNYSERSFRPVAIDQEILDRLGPQAISQWGFGQMSFQKLTEGKAEFQLPYADPPSKAVFDTSNDSWSMTPISGSIDTAAPTARCNHAYQLNNSRFEPVECVLETQTHRFEISEPHGRSSLAQVNTVSGERTALEPLLAQRRYTPFDGDFYIPSFRYGVLTEGRYWLATNLGLSVFDPDTSTWSLFDTRSGLVTNEIGSFVVTPKSLWVVTEFGGGLAGIKRE